MGPDDQGFEVTITDLGAGGDGVARVDGLVVFVPGAITGDVARVRITSRRRGFARAQLLGLVSPSPHRVAPSCPVQDCGGCAWRSVAYHHQLQSKRRVVVEALRRLGAIGSPERLVASTVPSPRTHGYRNRIRLYVRDAVAGYRRRGGKQLVPVAHCAVAAPAINEILGQLRPDLLQGVRQLELRCNQHGEVQAVVWPEPGAHLTADTLPLPGLVGLRVPLGPERGAARLQHDFGAARLAVSADSFVQVNSEVARALYQHIGSWLQPSPETRLLDLYSGVGAAGIVAAGAAAIVGIESAATAVADARHNALANGLASAHYHAGAVEQVLTRPALQSRFDAVIVNPPRAGCSQQVIDRLLALEVATLVYVSCDPATLARDIARLAPRYQVRTAVPFDMFPHTPHVETAVLLTGVTAGT